MQISKMNNIERPKRTARASKPGPLVFEIAIEQAQNQDVNGSGLEARSVVVQVESQGMLRPLALAPDPAEAARHEAEEVACEVALQAIEKDLPAGAEPACSPSPMGHLPDGLQGKAPSLYTPGAAAWLL
jgi:hypothetical protein